MSAMGADFSNEENRGTVLGYITVGNQAAYVVGPLIMGAVYAVDEELIFYVGAIFVAVGFVPIACLLLFWPNTRKPKKFKKEDHIAALDEYVKHPETWKYEEEKIKKKDYMKMGKDFGSMLSKRGYQWKRYYPRFIEILDMTFPPVRTDTFEHYYNDCRMVRENLEKVRWEFDHVKDLQQVSLMGEASHVVH